MLSCLPLSRACFLSLSPVQLRRYMPPSLPLHSLSQHMRCWRADAAVTGEAYMWKVGLLRWRCRGTDLSHFSRVENGSWNITPIRSLLTLKPFYVVMERGTPLPHTLTHFPHTPSYRRGDRGRDLHTERVLCPPTTVPLTHTTTLSRELS